MASGDDGCVWWRVPRHRDQPAQRMRSALQETPGAIDDLNDALRDVIAELEASAETKIEASFGSTQSTIDSTVSHFPFKHTVP